jgi:Xaa-Pro aminopeptidase
MKKLTAPLLLAGSSTELSDLRYATGFAAVDPVVALCGKKRVHLVVPLMELGRARRQARRGVRVLTPLDLPIRKAQRKRLGYWALGLLRLLKVRRVLVPAQFPIGVARRLERGGGRVTVARGAPFPEREVKSAREITALREAQGAAAAAMRRAVRVIERSRVDRAGYLVVRGLRLRAEDVRRVIDAALAERDCVARETIVACGRASADPHEQGSGFLRAGEPIVIDIFPQNRRTGYWGDITRTVVKGEPSVKLVKMYAAVKAAQEAALADVRHGAHAKNIHRTVQKIFDTRAFPTEIRQGVAQGFTHSAGHGVGLDIHEMPSVGPGGGRLKKGNVVTIEPGLYYRDTGGVRIEDTVLVTARGFRHLAKCPKTLRI